MIKKIIIYQIVIFSIFIELRCLHYELPPFNREIMCGVGLFLLIKGFTEEEKRMLKEKGYTNEEINFMEKKEQEIGIMNVISCILLREEQNKKRKEAGILGKIGIYK